MNLKNELQRIFGLEQQIINGLNGELYLSFNEAELQNVIKVMFENNFELISLFCAENFAQNGFALFYAFEKAGHEEIPVLQFFLKTNLAASTSKIFPSACWYEREVSDGFGVEFDGAFDNRRLFLHETYPKDFHPLRKSFQNGKMENQDPTSSTEYAFKQVEGEGVYQIPVGPVHAGIIEPGHFRFSVIGETIFNLEVRLFYKHRGLEKLAEGIKPQECVKIAETISGDETVANAVGFCSAVEKICDVTVPKRALQLRTIFLELERIYSHLGDLAGMCVDVAYPVGASPFFIAREEIFRLNESLTGSRFMKGTIAISGVTKDVPEPVLKNLSTYLQSFLRKLRIAAEIDNTYFSVVDRFETTGKLSPKFFHLCT